MNHHVGKDENAEGEAREMAVLHRLRV
jgi:hypothetical protein